MVFFTCNGCGESLKKKAVEKHSYRCRSSQGITCIDCHKVFGDDFSSHLSCISEQEKYGGSDFTPKIMKGKKKQEDWAEILQKMAQEADLEHQFKKVLMEAAKCENVPRRRKKFQNFMQDQLKLQLANAQKLTDFIFTKLASMEVPKPSTTENEKNKNDDKQEETKKRKEDNESLPVQKKKKKKNTGNDDVVLESEEVSKTMMGNAQDGNEPAISDQVAEKSKKKKRSKSKDKTLQDVEEVDINMEDVTFKGEMKVKEEATEMTKKKKRKSKTREATCDADETKCVNGCETNETNAKEEAGESNSKKRRKSKREDQSGGEENKENDLNSSVHSMENAKVHSKKHKRKLDEAEEHASQNITPESSEQETLQREGSEFKWKTSIKNTLKANDSKMKLKKLEKIVVEEYLSSRGNPSLESEAKELFKEKLDNDKFILEDKYVELK